jgi:hypothetical protein
MFAFTSLKFELPASCSTLLRTSPLLWVLLVTRANYMYSTSPLFSFKGPERYTPQLSFRNTG